MSSEAGTPAPGSTDLERVSMWFPCLKHGGTCSRWFYSIPDLQKHFAEEHPGVECKLSGLTPEELQGKVSFYDEDTLREEFPHKLPPASSSTTQVGGKINCFLCGDTFESWDELSSHLEKKHPNQKRRNATSETVSTVESTDSPTASTSASATQASCKNDELSESKKKRKMTSCPHCPYETNVAARINDHLKLHEEGSNAVVCTICGWFVGTSPSGMATHCRVRHQSKTGASTNN